MRISEPAVKLPLHVDGHNVYSASTDSSGVHPVLACAVDARSAAFICDRCNAHDELVAALKLIADCNGADAERVMRQYARAALTKATATE